MLWGRLSESGSSYTETGTPEIHDRRFLHGPVVSVHQKQDFGIGRGVSLGVATNGHSEAKDLRQAAGRDARIAVRTTCISWRLPRQVWYVVTKVDEGALEQRRPASRLERRRYDHCALYLGAMFSCPCRHRSTDAQAHDHDGIAEAGRDVHRLIRGMAELSGREVLQLSDALSTLRVVRQTRNEDVVSRRE
jgi:hypothetical protein